MSDPSPDTPSVCPTCRSTQPAARHTGRWWRLTDGTVDDSKVDMPTLFDVIDEQVS